MLKLLFLVEMYLFNCCIRFIYVEMVYNCSLFFFFCFIFKFCLLLIEQSQLDDKDRTIRIQQNLITKLETEMDHTNLGKDRIQTEQSTDTANTATQTDRVSKISLHPL